MKREPMGSVVGGQSAQAASITTNCIAPALDTDMKAIDRPSGDQTGVSSPA
jgi:hypothetical protein